MSKSLLILLFLGLFLVVNCSSDGHTNNWALLVCSSRFWYNYRHVANVLGMYRTVRRLGIPDDKIIVMLADDMACNPRNVLPGQIFNNQNRSINLYGDNIEVDYRGYEVNIENLVRLLTGRHHPGTPRSKRLLTDERSNILMYFSGHGGDEFLKFQDVEELSSAMLGDAFAQMHEKKRYNRILFMVDTCQANTLYTKFYSPNIIGIGSSEKAENALSHHADGYLGLSVIDRFTYYTLDYMERFITPESNATIYDLFSSYDPVLVKSHPGWRVDLSDRPIHKLLITDFFGSVTEVRMTDKTFPIKATQRNQTENLNSKDTEFATTVTHQDSPKIQTTNLFNTQFVAGASMLLVALVGLSFMS